LQDLLIIYHVNHLNVFPIRYYSILSLKLGHPIFPRFQAMGSIDLSESILLDPNENYGDHTKEEMEKSEAR